MRVDTNSFNRPWFLSSSAARRLVAFRYQQGFGFNSSSNFTILSRSLTSKGVLKVGHVEGDEEEEEEEEGLSPVAGTGVEGEDNLR